MIQKYITIFIVFLLFLSSCDFSNKPDVEYSFFVAGHAYGKAGINNDGLHPPFKNQFDFIKNYEGMSYGVLNGDFIYEGDEKDWEEVDRDIKDLGLEIHLALGNHEYRHPDQITKRFEQTYFSFYKNSDLHIVLDPNLDHWNISGEQLQFLKKELLQAKNKARTIFVYAHQVLWWTPENDYSSIRLNSEAGRDSSLTFWTEVAPYFEKIQGPVFMFAGDVGGATWADNYSYHQHENIHFISSGMGDGDGDNFLIVEQGDEATRVVLYEFNAESILTSIHLNAGIIF